MAWHLPSCDTRMLRHFLGLLAATAIACPSAAAAQPAAGDMLERMPAELETRFALSAAPPALRESASAYLLNPPSGYHLARRGTSGVACLVERTSWELADFRNDSYFPLCFDAAGAATYMKMIIDVAALRAEGLGPAALKAEIESRWKSRSYVPPGKAGVSYMVGPVMRTIGPPDLKVHTMAMPHLMFYAPNVTNADLGAKPDLADPETLRSPFIDRQGIDEHSYIIQLVGQAEKAKILARERQLIEDLCRYRKVLCLEQEGAHAAH